MGSYMTDDERLLSIFGERELFLMRHTAVTLAPPYVGAWQAMQAVDRWLLDGISDAGHIVADQLDKMAGERTGVHGREQDVSDELLSSCIAAAEVWISPNLVSALRSIQRARAAGKGEGV